jgi:hypothetical protein
MISPGARSIALLGGAILSSGLCVGGCVVRRPVVPMPVEVRATAAAEAPGCVVVLLPGRWNRPEAFFEAGFDRAAADRGLPLVMLAPDAHLGYYRSRSVLDRLGADVFARAEVQAADHLTVVGVSLGGLGGVLWTREGSRLPDQLVLLAPFLGPPVIAAEVQAAGGVAAWRRPATFGDPDFRKIWAWFQDWDEAGRRPPMFLSWGQKDDLAPALAPLGDWLGPEATHETPGGHDWTAWRAGWEAFLASGALDHCRKTSNPNGDV